MPARCNERRCWQSSQYRRVNPAHDLCDRRRATYLEANVQTYPSFGSLTDLQRLPRLRDIDAQRFLAISVFLGVNDRLKVLHMKPGRR